MSDNFGCATTNYCNLFLQNGSTDSTGLLLIPQFCSLNPLRVDEDRYESMKVIGERQATAAKTIFERATTPLGAWKK